MKVSLVLVHYHTPELARRAVESVHEDLARPDSVGLEVEIVLVDNGSDAAGREVLAALPVDLVEPGENLGYARGANLGAERTAGEVLVLANPDLVLLPGCLPALVRAVSNGAAAAGPRLYWDAGRRFLLPPAERRDRVSELAARLALRGAGWSRWARHRWRRHARRHWWTARPVESYQLSGALLAVRRDAWERVGPFDPGYHLYFEETDWLTRLEREDLRAVYEPRAEVVHRHNRSAVGEPRAPEWFAESELRYVRRWYGPLFRAILKLVQPHRERCPYPPRMAGPGRPHLDLADLRSQGALWVEVSPRSCGYPAAAERLPAGAPEWALPEEIWADLGAGRWRATVVDELGRELLTAAFDGPEAAGEPG